MSKGEGTLGNGLTLGVSGAQAGQGHGVLGARPLGGGGAQWHVVEWSEKSNRQKDAKKRSR